MLVARGGVDYAGSFRKGRHRRRLLTATSLTATTDSVNAERNRSIGGILTGQGFLIRWPAWLSVEGDVSRPRRGGHAREYVQSVFEAFCAVGAPRVGLRLYASHASRPEL